MVAKLHPCQKARIGGSVRIDFIVAGVMALALGLMFLDVVLQGGEPLRKTDHPFRIHILGRIGIFILLGMLAIGVLGIVVDLILRYIEKWRK